MTGSHNHIHELVQTSPWMDIMSVLDVGVGDALSHFSVQGISEARTNPWMNIVSILGVSVGHALGHFSVQGISQANGEERL